MITIASGLASVNDFTTAAVFFASDSNATEATSLASCSFTTSLITGTISWPNALFM